MSVQTTNYTNYEVTPQGRNAVVPMYSSYMNPRSPAPFSISRNIFTNNPYSEENAEPSHITTETPKFKKEGKALGAVSIIIGVVHFGFGIVLGILSFPYQNNVGFASLTFITGYPFGGGLCFIITGALSVSGAKQGHSCLVKGSLGMSIISAVFSSLGLILLLVDELLNGTPNQDASAVISGKGISAMLIVFSLVELVVSSVVTHFAIQAISKNPDRLF